MSFQFKVDRLQIILVAKKYISTRRNCSSVGCLGCMRAPPFSVLLSPPKKSRSKQTNN